MADIQERIKKIGQYFKGMQVTEVQVSDESTIQVIYVVTVFPEKWIVDESVTEKFGVDVQDASDVEGHEIGEYYFCAPIDLGFDKVFDAIDFSIQVNKDAMERAKIYTEKNRMLKELFGNEEITLDELKSLEFTFTKKKKSTTKKRTPMEEITDQETESNET